MSRNNNKHREQAVFEDTLTNVMSGSALAISAPGAASPHLIYIMIPR